VQAGNAMPTLRPRTRKHGSKRPQRVVEKELSGHPNRVRRDPEANGQIVGQLCRVVPAAPGDINRDNQRRQNHQHPGDAPIAHPAGILHQP